MTILLVNDDGYEAVGIRALEEALKEKGHEVWVSAPKTQMSGMSHAMTVSNTVDIYSDSENHYHMSGTPVDCVLYAKRFEEGLFPHDPDLVISGINNGYNLATDIMYSGTCGAAREAVFCGWKAIAVSSEKYDAKEVASLIANNLEKFYSLLDLNSFMNINIPPHFNGELKATVPGEVRYKDTVALIGKEGNKTTVRINAVIREDLIVPGALNDIEATKDGYGSISMVSVRSFSYDDGFKKLKEALN